MIRSLLLALTAACAISVPATAQVPGQPLGDGSVTWTPVNSFNGEYRLSIPCSEDEIGAWRQKINPELAASGAGCIKTDYTAIVLLFINTPVDFFETLVSKSKSERVSPEQLAGHRILRTLAAAGKDDGEVTSQFVELDKSRVLLVSFEANPTGTAVSRAMAAKFLNSLELPPQ